MAGSCQAASTKDRLIPHEQRREKEKWKRRAVVQHGVRAERLDQLRGSASSGASSTDVNVAALRLSGV